MNRATVAGIPRKIHQYLANYLKKGVVAAQIVYIALQTPTSAGPSYPCIRKFPSYSDDSAPRRTGSACLSACLSTCLSTCLSGAMWVEEAVLAGIASLFAALAG